MEINDTASFPEDSLSFSDEEVAVVKAALKTKLFRGDESKEIRTAKFQELVNKLAEVFGIPEPKFVKADGDRPGMGHWNQETNTITVERFSLTTTLTCFGVAVLFHKYGDDIRAQQSRAMAAMMAGESFNEERVGFDPLGFGLSMFKQAAPRMFQTAKENGRLMGTSVEYTDNGRLTEQRRRAEAGSSEETVDGGSTEVREEGGGPSGAQRPDIDPENRVDRGNGLGED